jgi:hypothetical protein
MLPDHDNYRSDVQCDAIAQREGRQPLRKCNLLEFMNGSPYSFPLSSAGAGKNVRASKKRERKKS